MGDPKRGERKTVLGEGRKSSRQFPKAQLTSLLYTAKQEGPVLGGHLGGWRFATIGDHGQALLSPTIQTAEMLASAYNKGDDWQDKVNRRPFIAGLKVGLNGKSPPLGGKPVCWMTKKDVLL